jgi:hypothetical protein
MFHQLEFEKTWNLLKAKGLFSNFQSYAEYKAAQKSNGIVNLKDQPKVGMMNPVAAAAKKFDEEYGDGGIDVSKIPF